MRSYMGLGADVDEQLCALCSSAARLETLCPLVAMTQCLGWRLRKESVPFRKPTCKHSPCYIMHDDVTCPL